MLASGNHWPRDGALLQGTLVVDKWGDEWLRTTHVCNLATGGGRRQVLYGSWQEAPLGSAIPMEYDDHYYLERVSGGLGVDTTLDVHDK